MAQRRIIQYANAEKQKEGEASRSVLLIALLVYGLVRVLIQKNVIAAADFDSMPKVKKAWQRLDALLNSP
jgi:hypothetical protein